MQPVYSVPIIFINFGQISSRLCTRRSKLGYTENVGKRTSPKLTFFTGKRRDSLQHRKGKYRNTADQNDILEDSYAKHSTNSGHVNNHNKVLTVTHSKAGQSIAVTIHYKLYLFEVGDNRTAWTLRRCDVFLVYLTYFPRGEISISELQFLGQSPAQIIWCNYYYYFHYYLFLPFTS